VSFCARFAWLLLALSACGYSVPGALPDTRLGRLAIHAPENHTAYEGLGRVVGDALRREALRRPGCELVEDPSRADWVLTGRVLRVEGESASLSPVVLELERELTLALELRARGADGREVRGRRRTLRETERYLSSPDPEARRKNRDEALRRAAHVLAARFLDRVAEAAPAAAEAAGAEDPA